MNPTNLRDLVARVMQLVERFRDAKKRGLFGGDKLFVAAAQGLALMARQVRHSPTKPLSPQELAVLKTTLDQLRQMGAYLVQASRGIDAKVYRDKPEGALVELVMALVEMLERLEATPSEASSEGEGNEHRAVPHVIAKGSGAACDEPLRQPEAMVGEPGNQREKESSRKP